jgi:hypothetical protein
MHVWLGSYIASQVTDVSLAKMYLPSLERLATLEELASVADDSGTASDELEDSSFAELKVSSLELELVTASSDELSGSIPGLSPVAPVEESESLPQLAQKKPATDKKLNRNNLRIFILPPFFP